jgi:peptide-methionine (R)-S-oxide reductase
MKKIVVLLIILSVQSCSSQDKKVTSNKQDPNYISKTDAEWKQILSPMAYIVLRESGTERAFSSPLNNNYKKGIYVCAACKTPLFESEYKFDSGTGWPSFDREITGNVAFSKDGSPSFYGIEEHCATCGGHLGHVFNDGPQNTTGKRHCINGVALDFIPNP